MTDTREITGDELAEKTCLACACAVRNPNLLVFSTGGDPVSEHVSDIAAGRMDDGERPFVPGINCWGCGRFVGRDGWIEIEHYEMSNEVASVAGQCGRCVKAECARENAGLVTL